jgi:hypothetical protein
MFARSLRLFVGASYRVLLAATGSNPVPAGDTSPKFFDMSYVHNNAAMNRCALFEIMVEDLRILLLERRVHSPNGSAMLTLMLAKSLIGKFKIEVPLPRFS